MLAGARCQDCRWEEYLGVEMSRCSRLMSRVPCPLRLFCLTIQFDIVIRNLVWNEMVVSKCAVLHVDGYDV
jgi:hypothetical protein